MSNLKGLYVSYCNWVCTNPTAVSEVEQIFTWGSMILCARSRSQIWPELLFSTSNLVALHNDLALLKKPVTRATFLKIWLSVIEHCEVLLEVIALSRGSSKRISVILAIQIIKCIGRLYLIKSHNEFLIPNPPFLPLNREGLEELKMHDNPRKLRTYRQNGVHQFKKSGLDSPSGLDNKSHLNLMKKLYLAEIIFSIKPLLHLLALYNYGEKSWTPWLLSLTLDVISNTMHYSGVARFPSSRNIVAHRYMRLLLYLLRSPLYDHIFRSSAMVELMKHLVQVPIFGTLIQLIVTIIPKYRHYYFYLWSH